MTYPTDASEQPPTRWKQQLPSSAADYESFAPFYSALFSADDTDVGFWRSQIGSAQSVAEIGCGNGRLTEIIARVDGLSVVGIDPSEAMLNQVPMPRRAGYRLGELKALPAADEEFDLTVCPRGAVSHVIEPDELLRGLRELARVTSRGGRVIIDVPRYPQARSTGGRFRPLLRKRVDGALYRFWARTSTNEQWQFIESTYRVKVSNNNEQVLLDQVLQQRQDERATPMKDDDAFELFACEQALRDRDLSPDEIADGVVGGGNDGGLDGVYVFLGDTLLSEDSDVLQADFIPGTVPQSPSLELWMVQAKRESSFSETAIEKVADSCRRRQNIRA